jgi:beta-mannosidase
MKRIDLDGAWEFWRDEAGVGESIGVFLPSGGTGVEPYWAAGWPGYEQTPAREATWEPITVPGHWQTQGFAGYQGAGWYRCRFTPATADGRAFLEFGGVDFYADVWLNGDYLGFHEGDFEPFSFDVADVLRPGRENLLVVRVSAPVDGRPEHKTMPKGGTYHWDALPVRQAPAPGTPEVPSAANPQYPNPVENPAGIWRPVALVYRSALHLASVKVTPVLKEGYREGEIFIEVTFENYTNRPISEPLRLWVAAHNFEGKGNRHPLILQAPPGRSTHTFPITMKEPALWWSWDLGFPHLYRLWVLVGGEQLPRAEILFGFREFTRGAEWELFLNGRRFFARGTNYLSDRFLSLMTPERYAADVRLIRDANMNMVRVFAHLEQEEFYRLCDEQGILLWQDLPFQWGYEPSGLFIQRAAAVAQAAVKQVYNHPSVVLFCAHSESRIHDFNKLDEVLLRTVRAADPSRPVVKSSVLTD